MPDLCMRMENYKPHSNLKPINKFLTLLSAEISINFVYFSEEKVHLPRWTKSMLSYSGCVSRPPKQLYPGKSEAQKNLVFHLHSYFWKVTITTHTCLQHQFVAFVFPSVQLQVLAVQLILSGENYPL